MVDTHWRFEVLPVPFLVSQGRFLLVSSTFLCHLEVGCIFSASSDLVPLYTILLPGSQYGLGWRLWDLYMAWYIHIHTSYCQIRGSRLMDFYILILFPRNLRGSPLVLLVCISKFLLCLCI